MNKAEWKKYVDSGEVPYYFFKSIAKAIKSGNNLTSKQLAVYSSNAEIIELLLSKSTKLK
tara:strand:- start:6836 stop:7015 length:180 start_codon:yes stop_codon:yes gene_type:complete